MEQGISSNTSINLSYWDRDIAEAIFRAIEPDNLKLPPGITLVTELIDTTLRIKIKNERNIGSLVSTLDDLLSCIQAAESTFKLV